MRSQDNAVRRLALDGMLVCLALVLSYIESAVGISAVVPGAKLGLANVAVMFAFYHTGRVDAALISVCRISIMSLLFGNLQYFIFSALGGACAYLAMLFLSMLPRCFGRIGVSVASAALHSVGQILAAVMMYSAPSLFGYLPVLLVASVFTGTLSGALLIFVEKRMPKKDRVKGA